MKKIIVKNIFTLAVVVTAGYTVYSAQTSSKMNGIALNNIEALASGESVGGGVSCCYGEYNPFGTFELLCSNCSSFKLIKVASRSTCHYK